MHRFSNKQELIIFPHTASMLNIYKGYNPTTYDQYHWDTFIIYPWLKKTKKSKSYVSLDHVVYIIASLYNSKWDSNL